MQIGPARGHIANSMALKNCGSGLYFMIPIKLSQNTTPFSCKEHIPSSKNEEMERFLKFTKENLSTFC
jgi:hypothetical protein